MENTFRGFLCLLLLLMGGMNEAFCQETLLGDHDFPVVKTTVSENSEAPYRTTGGSAPFPFFDDFSNDSLLPGGDNWAVSTTEDRRPGISLQRARQLPTKGGLVFDGNNPSLLKYSTDLESGMADELVSNFFDLSTYGANDSLFLSFFYERGGWGDSPEASDSLVLAFDTTGNGDYVKVWSQAGNSSSETEFSLVNLHLDQDDYFHPSFRFKLYSFGSLNGELDVWHVDYIYFAAGRGQNDNDFGDVSPTSFPASPLGSYTAVPRNHYQLGGYIGAPEVQVSNAGNNSLSATASLQISDPVGGNVLSGSTSQNVSAGALQPYAKTIVSASGFSDQAANMNQYGSLQMQATTSTSGDTRPGNNVLKRSYRVDTVLAYDDGSPDAGYGLTSNRSFVQAYRIPEPDTISAVWVAFTPSIHYNPVSNQTTCLNGATFKLALWDTLLPDSPKVVQGTGMIIQYDSADMYFQRFTFINPQVVDTLFWLGIQQNDNKPIGVGFDKHAQGAELYFQANNGQFQLSSLQGAVMIRPEFGNLPPDILSRPEAEILSGISGSLYPQPFLPGQGALKLRLDDVQMRSGDFQLVDMQGRVVYEKMGLRGHEFEFSLPPNVGSGLYIAFFKGKTVEGKQVALRTRCTIQR